MPAQHYCSRDYSREVRDIIAQHVYPFLGGDPALTLPPDCPLHPGLDIFRSQESHKSFVPGKRDIYQCGYCQKQFRTQFYMDRHMENKHADRLDKAEGSWGCLADLCDALGCGRHAGDQCGDRRGGAVPDRKSACGKCNASEMDHRRYKCKALFHRCFNPSSGASYGGLGAEDVEDLRNHFVRQFCHSLACDADDLPRPFPTKGSPVIAPPGSAGRAGSAKAVVVVLLTLGVAGVYATMAWVRWAQSTAKDLRRAAKRGDPGRGRGDVVSRSSVSAGSANLRRRTRPFG